MSKPHGSPFAAEDLYRESVMVISRYNPFDREGHIRAMLAVIELDLALG